MNDQDGLRSREKTPRTRVLRDHQRAWPFTRKLRPHQHRQSNLGRVRQTSESLHSHRRCEWPQLRDLGDIKVLPVLELLFQLLADERKATRFRGFGCELC